MATPPKNESAPAAAPAAPAAPAGKSLLSTLLPVVLVVILAPVVSWLVMQYVMLPQLEKRLAAAGSAPAAAQEAPVAAPAAEKSGHSAKKGEAAPVPPNTYIFSNVIVNLAGTMGTRYLKTTFMVTGSDQKLHDTFIANQPKLVDITLNVLASLSLADLEEAGAKNIIREKLVNAYNQALGRKVVEQIYFSDFVVQ
jgi:flagellar protein FliL